MSDDLRAPSQVLARGIARPRSAAVAAARDSAAVRGRHGARLRAVAAGRSHAASRPQPHGRGAADRGRHHDAAGHCDSAARSAPVAAGIGIDLPHSRLLQACARDPRRPDFPLVELARLRAPLRRQRQGGLRPRRPGGHLAAELLLFAVDRRKALVSFASILIVMPVVTFYLICDWHPMIDAMDRLVPVRQRDTVRELAHQIDNAIWGFLRGQFGVCLILGAYYALGLMLVGLDFALLIGLVAGLITFVPYIGSMTGLMIAASVAIAQFWPDWKRIVAVVVVFLVGQFIEGNIISPKLVGERVGLHPLWMIFAMFAFGYLFGFVGLLIAVPLAAAIAVLFRFALRQYLASPLYTGEKPP